MQTCMLFEDGPVSVRKRKARVLSFPQCRGCLHIVGSRCRVFVNRNHVFEDGKKCKARQVDPLSLRNTQQSLIEYRREHIICSERVSAEIYKPAVLYIDNAGSKWFVSKAVYPAYAQYRVYRLGAKCKNIRESEDMGTLGRDMDASDETVLRRRLSKLARANGWRRFRVREKSNVEDRDTELPDVQGAGQGCS